MSDLAALLLSKLSLNGTIDTSVDKEIDEHPQLRGTLSSLAIRNVKKTHLTSRFYHLQPMTLKNGS